MKRILLILSTVLIFNACDVVNQISGAYNFSQCEYTFNSLENIQLAGINLSSGSSISLSSLATIATILSGKSMQTIPFNMTMNLDVKNPNLKDAAFLNALDYAININDLDFASGKMDIPVSINAGETRKLPISIGVDLKNLMNRYSQDRVAKELNSFLGITSGETKITVKLWPTITVGNTPIKSPAAIPIVINYSGK